jgi:hypothetical protein
MFIQELSPLFQEIACHPASFLGGFASGLLRLNLTQDPVKSWLDQQARTGITNTTVVHGHKTSGPQPINID